MAGRSTSKRWEKSADPGEDAARARILAAAFTVFMKMGFAAANTAEIAARARVSKRELYALVGNKQEMLVACVTDKVKRLKLPTDLPVPDDRAALAQVLTSFGGQLIKEISEPSVVAVFRLAVAEAIHARAVAQALESIGRQAVQEALGGIMAQARESGLVNGKPAHCAEQFSGLLWGNLMISLLLGVAKRPDSQEIKARAEDAAAAFLRLHGVMDAAATRPL